MSILLQPYQRFFDFSGRSRRKEYWLYILVFYVVMFVLAFVDAALGLGGSSQTALDTTDGFSASASAEGGILTGIWAIANIIPLLACAIRRLHDTDRSGWWVLISLIPLIGTIWLIVLMCLDGTSGRNRFGPDPKDRLGRAAEAVFE
ncbi:DUF805 domain-containing protein [Aurantimonas sp. 22II-16-19i]|uniref:DUF805 domain-containing protein n=1 Tax=Aurantimonas sp. 22II-16-19i TaxID=1317114 RepID=UPI0009F800FD|nr:DUF805 domain-containing protein [Aurantimonas sp. 22II-16-19i]ORE89690.1 hypothetical protein ATO4_23882 [Aurantimonas sp. 22II-16-19i]